MKRDSWRIDSSTASTVTRMSRPNVDAGGDQIPERVRGVERREEDRDRRRVERVGRHRVLARRFELADDEQCRRDDDADGDADRWSEPSLLDRVAQEEDRGEHERDARDRREQLHADEGFPVDRERRDARRWLRWTRRRLASRRTRWWRRRCVGRRLIAGTGGTGGATGRGGAAGTGGASGFGSTAAVPQRRLAAAIGPQSAAASRPAASATTGSATGWLRRLSVCPRRRWLEALPRTRRSCSLNVCSAAAGARPLFRAWPCACEGAGRAECRSGPVSRAETSDARFPVLGTRVAGAWDRYRSVRSLQGCHRIARLW